MNDGAHRHLVDLLAVVAIGTNWSFQTEVSVFGGVLGCVWFSLQIYGWFSRKEWKK